MEDIDYVEVGRKAHELKACHGADALRYAWKISEEAGAAGDLAEQLFWKAVAASLTPRGT
jgi:hypothetical protein